MTKLKTEFGFDLLLDVTAVDWPGQAPRFEVVYHFYSTSHFGRARIKTRVPEAGPVVDSLTSLYGSASFMERECHEMYGIDFRGNTICARSCSTRASSATRCARIIRRTREQPLVPYRTEGA